MTVAGSLTKGEMDNYGPYAAAGGTEFVASMTGTGDADIYVRFGSAPTVRLYDCRPYGTSSKETCRVTVPAGGSAVYVSMRGYAAASYDATISYTKK